METLLRKYQRASALLHLVDTEFPDSLEIKFYLQTRKVELYNLEPGLDEFIDYARLKLQVQVSPDDSDD